MILRSLLMVATPYLSLACLLFSFAFLYASMDPGGRSNFISSTPSSKRCLVSVFLFLFSFLFFGEGPNLHDSNERKKQIHYYFARRLLCTNPHDSSCWRHIDIYFYIYISDSIDCKIIGQTTSCRQHWPNPHNQHNLHIMLLQCVAVCCSVSLECSNITRYCILCDARKAAIER